jgi:hypothetical protein
MVAADHLVGDVAAGPRSVFAYANNCLIDSAFGVVFDIEGRASSARRVEILFANLTRAARQGRLRLRSPGRAQHEFTLGTIGEDLRSLAKLVDRPCRN